MTRLASPPLEHWTRWIRWTSWTRRRSHGAQDRPPTADRVLVIRLGALGDVVRTLPAVSSLRDQYAHAHLAWLVEPRCAGVLLGQSWIDEVIEFPRPSLERSVRSGRWLEAARIARATAARLRAGRFDLVVDFHSILKSGVLARLSSAPLRIAWGPPAGREGAWWFAHHRVPPAPGAQSRFDRNRALVRSLGIDRAARAAPLEILPEARRRMQAALREAGIGPDDPWVAIHPGSSARTPHKRWGARGHAAAARALLDRRGLASLVVAGPDASEGEAADAVIRASAGAARRAPATGGFDELAALLEAARLFVGSDSGPLHTASLVGTPVVQILGPTHPVENAPWRSTPSRQVRVPLACSPCRRGCAAAHCLRVVPPEAVIEAAFDLLDETARRDLPARRAG